MLEGVGIHAIVLEQTDLLSNKDNTLNINLSCWYRKHINDHLCKTGKDVLLGLSVRERVNTLNNGELEAPVNC